MPRHITKRARRHPIMARHWRAVFWRLLGLAMMIACVSACANSREGRKEEKKLTAAQRYVPPGQTKRRVLSFEMEGIEQIDEDALREGLATKRDPGWRASKRISKIPVLGAEPSYYNRLAWERDRARIIKFYHARGYFDAQILNDRVREIDDPFSVEIKAVIKEGEPTRIASITIDGLSPTPIKSEQVKRAIAMKEGEIFTEASYLEAKSAMERLLKSRSYAYAQVKGRVIIDPKTREATVKLFADPGPRTVFGEVVVEGLTRVDEEYVRDAITIKSGVLYSNTELQETQENIYELGVFSLVTVQPEFEYGRKDGEEIDAPQDSTPRAGAEDEARVGALGISELLGRAQQGASERSALPTRVKIVIKVKEAKNWSVRVGAGFSINSNRQDVHGALNLQSRNFFGTLGKLEQFNTLGYALTPGLFSLNTGDGALTLDDFGYRGVYFRLQARYTQPQLIGQKTTGFLNGNVERDIQEAYIGIIPSASIGLRRPLFIRELTGEVSYNALFIYYQAFDAQYGAELLAQGLDPNSSNPSLLLEYLEQKLVYDGRDSPLNPTKGVRAQVSMQEARRYIVGGEYAFLKPRLQIEGYMPLGRRFVTGLRAGAGAIYNLNKPEEDGSYKGIPLQSRLYAGGKGSIRSFGPRYFGFFTKDLVNPAPIGSITLIETGVEQRMQLKRNLLDVGDLWGAIYLDSGTFFEQQLFFDTDANRSGVVGGDDIRSTFVHGLGLGAFWLTPIGPVRADFAYTLNNIRRDFRYTADPTTVDDPDTPRNELYTEYQYNAAVRNKLRRFDFYLGIGHSF